ncbi:MAG: pre-peptidase C-terminal domain-containing protein [Gemmatimonadota bacterium]|nr:pre-peptidase C-terminal domain-containing protein [Gemmatimonadota bacterium]
MKKTGPAGSVLLLAAIAGCEGGGTKIEGPLPDLVLANLTLSRSELVTAETLGIVAEIANNGEGATPAAFFVRLSVDGATRATVQASRLEPDSSTAVEFTAGPFETGSHTIELTVDPDGEIEELQEDNNSAGRSVRVQEQRSIGLNSPVTVSSSTVNEVLLFRVEITEPSDEALNVELSGGSGDADLFVHYGERPGHQYRYRCLSGNAASDELCQLVPTRTGTYHIAVHAYTAFGPSALEVTVGGKEVEPYDVELVFLKSGTGSQDNIIRHAAKRWEAVIGQGAADFDFSGNPLDAGTCGPGSPAVNDVVDDIRIYVTIDSIDGPGGSDGNIVGQAAPCSWRLVVFQAPGGQQRDTIHRQVLRGFIRLDEYDVAQMESRGVLRSVVTHEMAHVFGFGTLWDVHDRLRNPSVPDKPSEDTHFEGPLTIAAFDLAGGAAYSGRKVPVENSGLQGSADGHWRQSVFENELMTPFLVPGGHPMSAITLESLYEIGYEINLGEAESFGLSQVGVAGMAKPSGPVIYLGNDIARVPIRGLDQKTGRVVKVIYPEGR